MESCSVVFSKCAKALSGTALLIAELVEPAEPAPTLDDAVEVLADRALVGGARVFAEGVYSAELVSAFDPPEADPEDENEDAAAAPLAPAEAFA